MNQMKALESLQSELERKAGEFDEAKGRSIEAAQEGIKELRKLVDFVESSIISEIEEAFEVNRFANALGRLSEFDERTSKDELERINKIARAEVGPQMGPCRRDFLRVQEKIIGLGNWSGKKSLNVPTNVEGRSCGADSVEVVWDSVEKAMGYHVEMRRPNEGAFLRVYEGSETQYKESGLCSGTRLLFRVRSVLGNGVVSDWSECVEACSACYGVQYLCADAVSESEIVVSWDPVDVPEGEKGALAYHVEMRTKNQEEGRGNSEFQEVYCGSETMCSATGLKSEEEYLFTVRTMVGGRCISRSCIVPARTKIAAPKRLRARTDKWDSINLSWRCVASKRGDCVNYIVEMKKGDSEFAEIYRGEKTKIKKSEIEQENEYSFRVRSICKDSSSEWSDPASVRTQGIPIPRNFTVVSESWDTIKASWKCVPCDGEEMNYIVTMKGASERKFVEVYRGTDTRFVTSDLKQDTEYSFRIRSACKQGGSEWSEVATIKTQKIPVPSNFKVSGKTWGCSDLTWDDIIASKGRNTVNYIVEMKSEDDRRFIEVYRGTKTSFTKTELKQDTEYSFRVRSVCKDNLSEWSSITTIKTEKIFAPSDFSVTAVTSDSISLSWKGTGGGSYRIEMNGKVLDDKIESNSFTQKGLFPETEYAFRIRTVRGSEESEWGDPLKVSTGKAPDFSECTWKECPDDVNWNNKYSVDEENPRVATNIGSFYCTTIVNTPLPLNKVTSWNIKILESKNNDGYGIFIGVASSNINQNPWSNCNSLGWYFYCYDSTLRSGPPHNCRWKVYGPRKEWGDGEYVHTGDIIGVVMDTAKGDLSFVLNGVNLGVAYEGIPLDKPLMPCVLLEKRGDSIELNISEVKETVDNSIPVPSNITTKSETTWDSVTLTWDAVKGASFHQIQFDGSIFSVIGSLSSFTKRGLLPNTMHTFRVRTVRSNSVSEWSDVVKGRIQKESFETSGWKECPVDVDIDNERKYFINQVNPRIAIPTNNSYCTIVGNTPLPLNKITPWIIKVSDNRANKGNSYIGVAPSDINPNQDNFWKCGWYFNNLNATLSSGPPHNLRNKRYNEDVQIGDAVSVVMDTTKGELSFVVGGMNLGVAFEGIPLDKPLVPCVLLKGTEVSAELIIYKLHNQNIN